MTLLSKVCSNWVWFRFLRWFRQLHQIDPGDFACCKPPARCLWTADISCGFTNLGLWQTVAKSMWLMAKHVRSWCSILATRDQWKWSELMNHPWTSWCSMTVCMCFWSQAGSTSMPSLQRLNLNDFDFLLPVKSAVEKKSSSAKMPPLGSYLTHVACSRFVSWYDSYWKWWKCYAINRSHWPRLPLQNKPDFDHYDIPSSKLT